MHTYIYIHIYTYTLTYTHTLTYNIIQIMNGYEFNSANIVMS